MTKIQSVVRGVGGYLPERIITNEEMSKLVDTTDEWIVQRTGITERHVAAEGEFTSDLALKAAQSALDNAGLTAHDIDLIIIGTTTPDQTFPSTAAILQQKLGISHGFAFDIQAVCSGFVFALATADTYLKTGMAKRALVIGAETTTRLLDWSDRTTCVLFGDGAGAIILEAQEFSEAEEGRGILASSLRTDGSHWKKLYVDGGVSSTGSVGHLRMEGKEVFKHAVGMITDVIYDVLEKTGKDINDLTWFAPHQANKRIIDGAGKKLGIPDEKTIITVDKHANTSAASVPLALWVASQDGRIQEGDLVLLEAMGGGFTWGATLIRW